MCVVAKETEKRRERPGKVQQAPKPRTFSAKTMSSEMNRGAEASDRQGLVREPNEDQLGR